jgi:hypothetical protein
MTPRVTPRRHGVTPMPKKKPARRAVDYEPVFIEQEPVISHRHRNEMRRWNRVPYPYQLGKMDGAWLFVLFLFAGGFAYPLLWLIAGFITFMRCLVWCSFRWPLTTWFFTSFLSGLMSGGRRRRW